MTTGPVMRKRQLGLALRTLREDAGLTRAQAAKALDCADSRISHIENGRNAPRKPDLEVLCRLYNAPRDTAETLEAMRVEAGEKGWWSNFKLPAWFNTYVGLESDARVMRSFDGEAVPGLLQTPEYNRASHDAAAHLSPTGGPERMVEARTRRAHRLTTPPLLELHSVISEAAIERALGLGEKGIAQLEYLAMMSERDNIHIQVLPLRSGLHASMGGSFVLLEFPEGLARPAAYQEFAAGGQAADDQEIVGPLTAAWDLLHSAALGEKDSTAWMCTLLAHERARRDE